jgi:hypothetical protein
LLSRARLLLRRNLPWGFDEWLARGQAGLGFGYVLLCIAIAVSPALRDLSLYGGHDWDEMSAHRLLTVKALLEFNQFPLWMPYACGGFSEWGNVQGATNLVSPFLPFYLLLELRHALRVELVGTALISAVGTWLLSGMFTRNVVARTFACLVFVASGRFALQAATGHLWHLQYCYLPWVFWAFERLAQQRRFAPAPLLVGALAFALLVYSGGIYPLPHAAFLLAVYAAASAAVEKDRWPLQVLAALGALSAGLAAPKLLPVLLDFNERPRLVASTESIDFQVLWQALTASGQTPTSRPAQIPQWGWHEYGMYIGVVPAVLLALGLVWPAPRRELLLRGTAALALVLGFGAFHALSPWALLHQVSLFRSQHVPTRWLYPALLLLGVTTAAVLGRLIERVPRRQHLELGLLGGCLLLAVDIGRESSLPMERAFWMRPVSVTPAASFEQFERVPRALQYRQRDYAPEAVPAVLAGIGVLQCTMHASLNVWAPKGKDGRPLGMGARGRESKQYRGEVFTEPAAGNARLVAFSLNRLEVEVEGARPGDRLVINQNFDPGWSVQGEETRVVEPYQDMISTRVRAARERVVFEFWPRGLSAGLAILAVTLGALAGLAYWRRARAARLSP